MQVQTYDGRRVIAQSFVSAPLAMLPVEVAPTEKYMRALREGAADNYLDPLHQVGVWARAMLLRSLYLYHCYWELGMYEIWQDGLPIKSTAVFRLPRSLRHVRPRALCCPPTRPPPTPTQLDPAPRLSPRRG
jgi:hypothetical protein